MLTLSIMLMVGCLFNLAAGLCEPWIRDGGIRQGCPLSMMFTVALYLPWCKLRSSIIKVVWSRRQPLAK